MMQMYKAFFVMPSSLKLCVKNLRVKHRINLQILWEQIQRLWNVDLHKQK